MSRVVCQGNIVFGLTYITPFDSSGCVITPSASFTGSYAGDAFNCYETSQSFDGLQYGVGFSSNWADDNLYIGINSNDTFNTYNYSQSLDGLSNGEGYVGTWADDDLG